MRFNFARTNKVLRISLIFVFIIVLAVSYYGSYTSNLQAKIQNNNRNGNVESKPIITRAKRATRKDHNGFDADGNQYHYDIMAQSSFALDLVSDVDQKFNYSAMMIAHISILTISAFALFIQNIKRWVVKSCQFKCKTVYLHYVHLKDGKKDAGLLNFAF